MTQSSLPPEIRNLPFAERLDLVERIWDSIAEDEGSFVLTDAQKVELDRRLAAQEKAPDHGSPWEEVKRRILGQ